MRVSAFFAAAAVPKARAIVGRAFGASVSLTAAIRSILGFEGIFYLSVLVCIFYRRRSTLARVSFLHNLPFAPVSDNAPSGVAERPLRIVRRKGAKCAPRIAHFVLYRFV